MAQKRSLDELNQTIRPVISWIRHHMSLLESLPKRKETSAPGNQVIGYVQDIKKAIAPIYQKFPDADQPEEFQDHFMIIGTLQGYLDVLEMTLAALPDVPNYDRTTGKWDIVLELFFTDVYTFLDDLAALVFPNNSPE